MFYRKGKSCSEISCSGTDRFHLPKRDLDLETIPLHQTFVMHREAGEVYELGKPEEWTKLPKTHRYQKSKPVKVCVTIFRSYPGEPSSSTASARRAETVPASPPSMVISPDGRANAADTAPIEGSNQNQNSGINRVLETT